MGTSGAWVGVSVRKMAASDREAVYSIIRNTSNLTGEEKNCATELVDIYLNNPLQTDYYFIAAVDMSDRPVGYVCYGKTPLTDAVYDLYWILVDADSQGRGIGKKMIESTEAILKAEGGRMLVAETSGLPTYEAARTFYAKCGFREEARIKEFYKPGDDLIIYVKRF